MKTLLIGLLLQTLPLPPRTAVENPTAVCQLPEKLKKDYHKLWPRFVAGTDDSKLAKDLDKLLRKQPQDCILMIAAYLELYRGDGAAAARRLDQAVSMNPKNRIAVFYLAELAFAENEYARSVEFYTRLLALDNTWPDMETKRRKALLLATEDLLRSASLAEEQNRLTEAENLYRQILQLAPADPVLHGRMAALLARQNQWGEAVVHYRKQLELAGPDPSVENSLAQSLIRMNRSEEAREILERRTKPDEAGETAETKTDPGDLEDIHRWGRDIDLFHSIKAADSISRELLALTVVRYFPHVRQLPQRPQIVTDTETSQARDEIQTLVGLGVIDPLPNHTVQPAGLVTRGQLAVTLGRMIPVLGLPRIPGGSISVPDVTPSNAQYRDVQLVLAYGVMEQDKNSQFNPSSHVSGQEAIRALERLASNFQQARR